MRNIWFRYNRKINQYKKWDAVLIKECQTPAFIHKIEELDDVIYYYLGHWTLGYRTADQLEPLYFVEDSLNALEDHKK